MLLILKSKLQLRRGVEELVSGAWGAADMTYAYLYDKNCFMVCQIVNISKMMKIFKHLLQLLKTPPLPQILVPLRPFSIEVWISILVTFALSIFFGVLYGAFYPLSNTSGVQMTFSVVEMLLGNSISKFWKFQSFATRLVMSIN